MQTATNFLAWLHITPREIVAALVMYIIVHSLIYGWRCATSEAGKIMRKHTKHHQGIINTCKQDDCIKLRDRSDRLQQVVVELPVEFL